MFYMVFCECTLKVRNSVHREDEVSIIDEESVEEDNNIGEAGNAELPPVFHDSTRNSKSETSVSIDVPPSRSRHRKGHKGQAAGGSLPQPQSHARSGSVSSISSYPYSLPHSYFNPE